jgi:TonB family protein
MKEPVAFTEIYLHENVNLIGYSSFWRRRSFGYIISNNRIGERGMSRVSLSRLAAGGIVAAAFLSASAMAADAGPKVDTSKPTPVIYPVAAQQAGEEGTVVMNVYINNSGAAKKIAVAKSSGYVDLDTAAVETALNWHYVPAIRGGDTVSDWAAVQVVYKLPEGAAKPDSAAAR